MDHPFDDLEELLQQLERMRRRDAEEHGPRRAAPQTMAVARELPSRDLYARLDGLGVTATIALPWRPADRDYATLAAKVTAMEQWADAFMR